MFEDRIATSHQHWRLLKQHLRSGTQGAALALLLNPLAGAADADTQLLFNPKPLDDDVELPLPCGGKMVFRYVYILGKGPLDDRSFNLGHAFSEDEPGYRQAFMASSRKGFISGQFMLTDLPAAWQERLKKNLQRPAKDELQPLLYFIGKYEVTDWQYRLVMAQADGAATCPKSADGLLKQRLPKVNLSWFEALRFTEVYNQWLAQHGGAALPSIGGALGSGGSRAFVRLPTEAEWEFAARGGHNVDNQALEGRLFPRPSEGGGEGALGDWAVYQALAGGSGFTARLMPIGTKKPNPLGMHDVIGNAAEMLLEPFHLVRGSGRFHGAAGGFVVKGGNYTEGEGALFTGMRREYPFFNDDGSPRRNETTGLRLVLTAIAAPTARLQTLAEQWQQDGRIASVVDLGNIQDPTQLLDTIIAASSDENQKQALSTVSSELKSTVGLLAEQRKNAVANLIQSAALIAETVSNYNVRIGNLQKEMAKDQQAGDTDAVASWQAAIANGNKALRGALAIYADNIVSCVNYPEAVVNEQAARVREELGRKEVLGSTLLKRTDLFLKHVQQYRQTPKTDLNQLLEEVLASNRRG